MDIDLKLLKIFDEIYKTGSVSRAADNIGLSQPTISIALSRLREYFNDPLFVRTAAGMEPTPQATALIHPIRQALLLLHDALGRQVVFDPHTSTRTFKICMTDISQIVILPRLINHLEGIAPSVRIEVMHISSDTAKMLASGDADLAIGFLPQLDAGFYQQRLFRQNFLCMARKDHPRIGDCLSMDDFVNEAHVIVTTSGTGHTIVDKMLEDRQIARRIELRVPNFLGIANIVANTNLIVTIPQRLGELLSKTEHIKLFPPPMELPSYDVKQHWHERYHQDPGNRWLREVVANLLSE